ncbi:MAG: hypothetical protein NWQ19_10725, partial [Nonlabens sp.]|nr:hypothetical protein [Nonlabens sp.]
MRTGILLLILCCSSWMHAQEQIPVQSSVIDSLLSAENFVQAEKLINKNITYYFKQPALDSLAIYPLRIGKAAIALQGNEIAEKKVLSFIAKLEQRTKKPRILFQTYLSLDELYLD